MAEQKRKQQNRHIRSLRDSSTDTSVDPMEIYRRHFESQFEPIEVAKAETKEDDSHSDDVSSNEEWSGISDSDNESHEASVKIIDASKSSAPGGSLGKSKTDRSFMSSKPPSIIDESKSNKRRRMPSPESDSSGENGPSEVENMRNDLALQRLLKEAHLLDPSASKLEATGKNRIKALDLRVQSLGGRSITEQNMPMKMRKGMIAVKREREQKRRKEAKETDTVLERPERKIKVRKARDRGLEPSVGRFKNGMLLLSKRDVKDIHGEPRRESAKGSRGKKRR